MDKTGCKKVVKLKQSIHNLVGNGFLVEGLCCNKIYEENGKYIITQNFGYVNKLNTYDYLDEAIEEFIKIDL